MFKTLASALALTLASLCLPAHCAEPASVDKRPEQSKPAAEDRAVRMEARPAVEAALPASKPETATASSPAPSTEAKSEPAPKSAPSKPAGSPPSIVEAGIFLTDVPSVKFKEKTFQVDFKVFFRWKDDDISPIDSFEIVNGHIDNKDSIVKKKVGNVNYASARVEATIHRNFDLARYPLDSQTLKIQIEDRTGDIAYKADVDNSKTHSKIVLPGWKLGKPETYASTTKYQTTYGDPSLGKESESSIPRLTMSLDITRLNFAFFFKNFSTLFLAAYCAFACFFVPADRFDLRLSFILSAVFIASGTQTMLMANLPDGEGLTLGDIFYSTTTLFIVVSLAGSVRSFLDTEKGEIALAEKHSKLYAILLSITYPLALLAIAGFFFLF